MCCFLVTAVALRWCSKLVVLGFGSCCSTGVELCVLGTCWCPFLLCTVYRKLCFLSLVIECKEVAVFSWALQSTEQRCCGSVFPALHWTDVWMLLLIFSRVWDNGPVVRGYGLWKNVLLSSSLNCFCVRGATWQHPSPVGKDAPCTGYQGTPSASKSTVSSGQAWFDLKLKDQTSGCLFCPRAVHVPVCS